MSPDRPTAHAAPALACQTRAKAALLQGAAAQAVQGKLENRRNQSDKSYLQLLVFFFSVSSSVLIALAGVPEQWVKQLQDCCLNLQLQMSALSSVAW